MLRLGAAPAQTREMDLDDIYLARVRLLIIMAKAYLEGCGLGDLRRQAMLENARHVESESIDLGSVPRPAPANTPKPSQDAFDQVFYQRVKLLAVMMKAVAKGFPMEEQRKAAMQENLDDICDCMSYDGRDEVPLLKVA